MKSRRLAALAILLSAPLALPSHALLTVTPLLGVYKAEAPKDAALSDGLFGGLAAGVQISPMWAVEAEYGKGGSGTSLLGGNVLISPASWSSNGVSPYILTGLSKSVMDYSTRTGVKQKSADTDINLGYGLLYAINNRLSARGELRFMHNSDHSLNNYLALAGVQYRFGQMQAEASEAPPAQSGFTLADADADGDGVVDANDRCPNTPVGWEVGPDGCPLDNDKDKVPNSIDQCPNTPQGQPVAANGCPLDDDKDGVPNAIDKCPNTKANVVADEKGCDKVITQKVEQEIHIVFDSGQAVIKPEFKAEVAKIADLAKQYPTSFISIEGHTDNSGKASSNLLLSQQRADAVRMMLINAFSVAADRLTAKGYGSSKPIADNATPEGKAKNRRVIAVLTAERQVVEVKPAPAAKAAKGGKVRRK